MQDISVCENFLLHQSQTSSLDTEFMMFKPNYTHTDTHLHYIKYALGELAIGLGRRPGVIC